MPESGARGVSFPLTGVSRAVQPQEFSRVDVEHWHIVMPLWASYSTFCVGDKLIESAKMAASAGV